MLRTWELLGGLGDGPIVDVAKGDHVLAADGSIVRPAAAAHADQGDVELVAGSVRSAQGTAGEDRQPGANGGGGL